MQEQAEADGDGVRVPEEVVWFPHRAEPEAAEGSGRATSHEGGPTHRDLPSLLRAAPCLHTFHVSPLRACHLHRRQTALRRRRRRHFVP